MIRSNLPTAITAGAAVLLAAGPALALPDLYITSVTMVQEVTSNTTTVTVWVKNGGDADTTAFVVRIGVTDKDDDSTSWWDTASFTLNKKQQTSKSRTFNGLNWECGWGHADQTGLVTESNENNNNKNTNHIWRVIDPIGHWEDFIGVVNSSMADLEAQLVIEPSPPGWEIQPFPDFVIVPPESSIQVMIEFQAPPGFEGYEEVGVVAQPIRSEMGPQDWTYHFMGMPIAVDTVVCEPQGGENPVHPPTYWYDVTPTDFGRCDFHVEVFDPVPGNYIAPSLPAPTWKFAVHQVGTQWFASWWDPGCENAIFDTFRFQFTNPNPSTWGHWTTTIDGSASPFAQVVDCSATHETEPDGDGYRVHVPYTYGVTTQCWADNFDSYDTTTPLPDQSTWEAWEGDPAYADFYATTAQAYSTPNSVAIDNDDDAVHQYSGFTEGVWAYSAWQYIPPEMDDIQYFILINTYPAATSPDWSMQIECDGGAGLIRDFNGDETLPMVKGAWVPIQLIIDLDQDQQSVYYDGQHLVTKSWSEGVAEGGQVNIAAVDLFGNGSAYEVYYDDMSLCTGKMALDGPDFDPYQPVFDPLGYWHELWPVYCTYWKCIDWIDNGNGILDYCDYIEIIRDFGDPEWWHIENVTITVTLEGYRQEGMLYLDWLGPPPGNRFDPIGPWHEIWPNYCTPWECIDWFDSDGDGKLGYCDWMIFETPDGIVELHVVEVATDIDVTGPYPQPPEPCPADINGDGVVDVLDLLEVLAQWGTSGPADINGDGIVDVLDLLEVLAAWGPC